MTLCFVRVVHLRGKVFQQGVSESEKVVFAGDPISLARDNIQVYYMYILNISDDSFKSVV